jgi:hypothetical protein
MDMIPTRKARHPTAVRTIKVTPQLSFETQVVVSPCDDLSGNFRRQDDAMPLPFPRNTRKSQVWNEKCYIHCLRMVAIAIDVSFQNAVEKVCLRCSGEIRKTAIKSFGRMVSKCVSKADHYFERYPRPSLNTDVNRNCSTFEDPEDLLMFIEEMKLHPEFDNHPVRLKNMFLFDAARAKKQFYYRTVMINWLYTPGMTFKEMAGSAAGAWDRYYDFACAPGFGGKDTSEAWSAWRAQIQTARAYLTNPAIENFRVQLIVETQCLLRPFLNARTKMHLFYKIHRAVNPQALCSEFQSAHHQEERAYEAVQQDALEKMEQLILNTDDVNRQDDGNKGATLLWDAAAKGHVLAVRAILKHPKVDPNRIRQSSKTTPLFIAAHNGHDEVVEAIISHVDVKVNMGAVDTGISPLFMAVQEGHERVVEILLQHKDINVDQQGVCASSPLSKAAQLGREYMVGLLLAAHGVDVTHTMEDGVTVGPMQTREPSPVEGVAEGRTASKKILHHTRRIRVCLRGFVMIRNSSTEMLLSPTALMNNVGCAVLVFVFAPIFYSSARSVAGGV